MILRPVETGYLRHPGPIPRESSTIRQNSLLKSPYSHRHIVNPGRLTQGLDSYP